MIKDKSKKIKVEEKKNDLCDRLFEFAVRVIESIRSGFSDLGIGRT